MILSRLKLEKMTDEEIRVINSKKSVSELPVCLIYLNKELCIQQ